MNQRQAPQSRARLQDRIAAVRFPSRAGIAVNLNSQFPVLFRAGATRDPGAGRAAFARRPQHRAIRGRCGFRSALGVEEASLCVPALCHPYIHSLWEIMACLLLALLSWLAFLLCCSPRGPADECGRYKTVAHQTAFLFLAAEERADLAAQLAHAFSAPMACGESLRTNRS